MHDAPAFPFLREILLFLVLAGVLIPLLQRLRVNQVVGFLAAGVALGPFGLGLWAERWPWLAHFTFPKLEGVAVLAELGVLFLMFMIGLELSLERLWALRRWVFGAGLAQLLASTAVIGALAWAFGNPWPAALVLGGVLALSSTAVALQLLIDRGRLGTPLGQACFSVLMMQDLAVVPLLVLVGVLAEVQRATGVQGLAGLGEATGPVLGALAKAAVAVVAIAWFGRRLVRPVFRTLALGRQPDVFMALTLLATLSIAGLTAAAGLSMALGALLAGLLLSETEFRHEVEVTIEPFRGLLMGLFFMSVGMGIDVREIAAAPLLVPASVLGLFAIKAAVLWVVLRAGGLSQGRAIEGGLLLGQGGEFAFIVVGVATLQGLLPASTGQFMLLVVALSLAATPLAARLGHELGERIDRLRQAGARPEEPDGGTAAEALRGHVVIAGFGRVGEAIAGLLDARGVRWVALETDATRVTDRRAHGAPVWFGNATRVELLARLHAGEAAAIVLTMDQPASALHALRAIRRQYPAVTVVARSRDEAHAAVLRDEGATVVIPETLEASLQMSAVVLHAAGVPESVATAAIDAERERRIGARRG